MEGYLEIQFPSTYSEGKYYTLGFREEITAPFYCRYLHISEIFYALQGNITTHISGSEVHYLKTILHNLKALKQIQDTENKIKELLKTKMT